MQRQVWIFLDDADEEAVLRSLDAGQGLRRLNGRFFRGTEADLRSRSEQLETAELKATERWIHLLHPTATQALVVHEVPEGPFQGWSRLDEVRSEVITLVRPLKDAQGLAPGQLRANTHAWFGGEKLRKSAAFSTWAADAMRTMEGDPSTAFDWIRVAPAAAERARAGGRLHYLFRAVSPEPGEVRTAMSRPHASIKED